MKDSNIEWTDHTFNPWWGCTKVSPGCKNCYAETLANRYQKDCWGPKGIRKPMSEPYWKQPHKWNREAEAEGIRRRVFCASMADVFEGAETMPKESWDMVQASRRRLWELIDETPWLDWLLLTKRPENVTAGEMISNTFIKEHPNMWLGTSVENAEQARKRIHELVKIPAAVRFLSCEPLIENPGFVAVLGIHWVIVGGESGPGKRPFDPAWGRSILNQCKAANVAFFGKQWDKVQPLPDDLMVRQFPQPAG